MKNKAEFRHGQPVIEMRSANGVVELREADEGSTTAPVISGYAAVYDTASTGLGYFTELIMPGAFDETDFSGCIGLFNHDENIILGSVRAGTVKIEVDAKGLRYEITPPSNDYIRNVALEPMRRGDLNNSSFRFSLDWSGPESPDEWLWDYVNDVAVRKIHKIARVTDVSPVLFPAYDAADSSLRKAGEVKDLAIQARIAEERSKKRVYTDISLYM